MATWMGMYMEVGMYSLEKSIRDGFRSYLSCCLQPLPC